MITEARGDSPEVSLDEYREHTERGEKLWHTLTAPQRRSQSQARTEAWEATREHWGGVTLNPQTLCAEQRATGYAVSINPPGSAGLRIPITAHETEFNTAFDTALYAFQWAPYIGIFRDDDTRTIDLDPVAIVDTAEDARDLATYCRSIGGAYDYATGNGIFPYHVSTSNGEDDKS